MGAASPLLEDVVSGTSGQIAAITTPVDLSGKVEDYLPRFETRWEDLRTHQDTTTGQLDWVYLDVESTEAIEGPAAGERYQLYNVVAWYYAIRKNVATFKLDADKVAQSIVAKVNGNASIFRIGSQRQLFTAEVMNVRSAAFVDLPDEDGNPERVYEAQLIMQVEARDWD